MQRYGNRIFAWLPFLNARKSLIQRGLPPLNDGELVLNSYQLSLVTRWPVRPATGAEENPSAFSSRGNRSHLAYLTPFHKYKSCFQCRTRGRAPVMKSAPEGLMQLDQEHLLPGAAFATPLQCSGAETMREHSVAVLAERPCTPCR